MPTGSGSATTTRRGGLLAGGIAYFAFFSVFPALTLGFAIFGFVLRGHLGLFHDVVELGLHHAAGHRQGRRPSGRRHRRVQTADPQRPDHHRRGLAGRPGVLRPRLAGRAARGHPVDVRPADC